SLAMAPAVTDGLRGASAERLQQRPELQLRLGQLPFGLGLRDDAATRVERRAARVDQRRAKSHGELAVAVEVGPADGAAVPAAVDPLEAADRIQRLGSGPAADG